VGHIIPPNLIAKTHILKRRVILQPNTSQVQHIVVKIYIKNETTMEKINLEGDHVPWPDGGLERTGTVLEPMKLNHLVKICGICQANGIHILDALSAL
jgi:hypothetical protein